MYIVLSLSLSIYTYIHIIHAMIYIYICTHTYIYIYIYTLAANSAIFTGHSQSCLVPQAEAMHDVPKEKPKKATAPWPSDGGIFVRCDVTSRINIGFFMLRSDMDFLWFDVLY